MSNRRRKRQLRKQQQLGRPSAAHKRRRKSRTKNPDGLPKGAWPAPDGGYYIESGRHGPVPAGDRRIIATGKRRATVDIDRLIAAAVEMTYTQRKSNDSDLTN